ncbi:hypothetical protein [Hymenobacter terrenus]|uniref:hypothetical protein n=1 Tax=Hymenobacter terrenus TaxID=1629124 RepID=UPI00061961E6|nr:hypothetical protein [Hymenobacter terrenus]
MLPVDATTLGRSQTLFIVTIGAALAYLLAAAVFGTGSWLTSLLWLGSFDYWPNVLVAAGALYLSSWVYGGWAGRAILVAHRNAWGVGILVSEASLLTATVVASSTVFFREALPLQGTLADALVDYLGKPLWWVMGGGWLPAAMLGLWLGYRLKG